LYLALKQEVEAPKFQQSWPVAEYIAHPHKYDYTRNRTSVT